MKDPRAPGVAGFEHIALLYQSAAEFTAGVLPFVEAGAKAAEPVVVAAQGSSLRVLRAQLAGLGDRVAFTDLVSIGPNPGRLLGWMRQATQRHRGLPVRYIHETVWPSRRPEEIGEIARHEALINQILDRWQVSVLCPYDLALGPEIIANAERTHPVILSAGQLQASQSYDPQTPVSAQYDRPMSDPPAGAAVLTYRDGLAEARAFAAGHARRAGLPDLRVQDLVIAVGELAANTFVHTSGPGTLAIWATLDEVICQISDTGHIEDPLAGRIPPDLAQAGGRGFGGGLWVVHQLCDLVELRTRPGGTQIRLHIRFTQST